MSTAAWPYSRWIAHRGAGKLAPENTLAAFKLGYSHGYRMFECDVKLSADGVPFLLHDATLDRTSNGHGIAGAQTWQALAALDAGSWHGSTYAGEGLPTLAAVAEFCLANDCLLNIEIKPTPGHEAATGEAVANAAAQLWRDASVAPLLTSFSPDALRAAKQAQPQLLRGLLLDALEHDWIASAEALGCVAIVCKHTLWTAHTVAQAKAAGCKTLCYTVNEEAQADRLWALGVDGIVTDRVDQFSPS